MCTGFDYLGEPTPYYEEWPSRSSYFGTIDLCGIPKDRFYLYQSKWTDKKTLHILPHWTWPGREGEITPVHCYSSWDTVELFVNGVSQGVRTKNPKNLIERYRLVWNSIIYKPGELKVVAYDGKGKPVQKTVVRTAGKPAGIHLASDRKQVKSDGDDMAFICISIVDTQGNLCPSADNLVRFNIKGPAEIAGADNGNPASIEPFQADFRKAFNGKCMLSLRSIRNKSGKVTITAESKNLKKGTITLTVR
jgi:beta-galactosidase